MGHDRVVFIFNEMRDDYDDLRDLWYSWLFSRLHFYIAKHVICKWDQAPRKVLDVGCGTGLQSFLYGMAGAKVSGIDIADELVSVAREKISIFEPRFPFSLFVPHFRFVTKYDNAISHLIAAKAGPGKYVPPKFDVADATNLPFQDESFDHVNCCGSTLSFIKDYDKGLAEIARVLKRGGTFVLEVEAKYNFDLLWTVLDPLVFGALGFETSLKEAMGILFSSPGSHVTIDYPFGDMKDPVYMDIWLFSGSRLKRDLSRHGLRVEKTSSIHSITNLIPSTFLDSNDPSKPLVAAFRFLARIEESLPARIPGCSLVLFGKKV